MTFLIDENSVRLKRELELSLHAGELVGKLYDAFVKSYADPNSVEAQSSLSKLCVRLVFCFYADDSGIFPDHRVRACLERCSLDGCRRGLVALFSELKVGVGTLFNDDHFDMPELSTECHRRLREAVSFNWSGISPTIFGALFESTLNSTTRRSGGMHYTSIDNIHRVIDPLFLDELRAELEHCGSNRKKLVALQSKLGSLTFFDPACGSGNFLTETYLSLRRLENKILERLQGGAIKLGAIDDPIQVTIDQFHGIEINDFAVAVARTALWIAEHQMLRESAAIIHREIEFLPIKTNAHIVEGNALRLDWQSIVPSVDYIMGNPPFVGASMMNATQKSEVVAILGKGKLVNSVDYVGGWFHKAAAFMIDTETRAAFVSTNSITQGEQVAPLWRKLLNEYGAHIDFAWRSFRWENEIKNSAAVHCVVIGFSVAPNTRPKIIFDGERTIVATNINPYLIDAPNIMIESRSKPICADAPRMMHGNFSNDGKNLILTEKERAQLLRTDPTLEVCIRRFIGGRDFVGGGDIRYCLWLKNIEPKVYRHSREIMRRLEAVRAFRLNSSAADTRAKADVPYLFFRTPHTDRDYLCFPQTSSSSRRYIPIGCMDGSNIAADTVLTVPNATLYHFGVLNSSVHMAWMRAVGGRFGMGYRYSTSVVYNTFPWCTPTDDQIQAIERSARRILDVRSKHEGSTLADLYDDRTMPIELRKAHSDNDRAVLDTYGFDRSLSESEIVARLMVMYERLTR